MGHQTNQSEISFFIAAGYLQNACRPKVELLTTDLKRSHWALRKPGPEEHAILVAEIGAGMKGIPVVADHDIPWEQRDILRPG